MPCDEQILETLNKYFLSQFGANYIQHLNYNTCHFTVFPGYSYTAHYVSPFYLILAGILECLNYHWVQLEQQEEVLLWKRLRQLKARYFLLHILFALVMDSMY